MSYLLIQAGYVLQSQSARNVLIFGFATACNVGWSLAEESCSPAYQACQACREQVRWRLIPYLW
jgi:hypothetical protein